MKYNKLGLALWCAICLFIIYPFMGHGSLAKLSFSNSFMLSLQFSDIINNVFAIVCTYSVLYFYYEDKRWLRLILLILIVLSLPIAVRYFLQEVVIYEIFGRGNYSRPFTLPYYIRDNYINMLRIVLLGSIYFMFNYSRYKEQKLIQSQLHIKEVQVTLLQSQLNPHFLLNSLNSIYSLVYHQSNDSLRAIEYLSEILKYGLYHDKRLVSLEKELNYVDQFISLHRLRTSIDGFQFDIDIEGDITNKKLPYFLLITLIENVFKHGSLSSPIRLSVGSTANELNISLENKMLSKKTSKIGGIGTKNIRKRLVLIYEGAANMEIFNDGISYKVILKIPQI